MPLPCSLAGSETSVEAGGHHESSPSSFVRPRRVLVIRAGPRPRRHACLLLNRKTANLLEHVLSAIASAVSISSGHVKQLYGVNTGTQVTTGDQPLN